MTVITIITARSLWYADMRQLNPRGRNIFRLIVPLLQQWYGFTPPEEFDEEKGVRFIGGEFSLSGRNDDLTGIEVTVYHNGLIANSRTTTDDTDHFLDQLLRRLVKEGVIDYRPEMIKRKQYSSEIISRFDKQLVVPALEKVCELLSQYVYAGAQQFVPSGLTFDIDPVMPGRQVPFKFERRAGAPLSENTYYSHGPLKTEHHIAVLEAIEEALAVTQPGYQMSGAS